MKIKKKPNKHINLALSRLKQSGCMACRNLSVNKKRELYYGKRPLNELAKTARLYDCIKYPNHRVTDESHEKCHQFYPHKFYFYNQAYGWIIDCGSLI